MCRVSSVIMKHLWLSAIRHKGITAVVKPFGVELIRTALPLTFCFSADGNNRLHRICTTSIYSFVCVYMKNAACQTKCRRGRQSLLVCRRERRKKKDCKYSLCCHLAVSNALFHVFTIERTESIQPKGGWLTFNDWLDFPMRPLLEMQKRGST